MRFDIDKHTILKVVHGSHAYGLNIASSDVDIKGVCIEPIEYHFGFLNQFEQYERSVNKGHEADVVVYSLKKFAALAAACNPNIIEVLFVDDSDVLYCTEIGETLRNHRHMFLSKQARNTFSGYARGQLKRIKNHRQWLLTPPKYEPKRSDFGLADEQKLTNSDLGALDKLVSAGEEGNALTEPTHMPNISVLELFAKEKRYAAARKEWAQYQNWVKTRNPTRAELEAKFGYDTKHAQHLIRLMRMCKEILEIGEVIVKRPDRDELLAIRRGERTYESLIEEAERLDKECDKALSRCILPAKADVKKLDDLVVTLTKEHLGNCN